MRLVGKYEQRSAKLHRLLALNVGSRIAHYDVTALIGQGGMSEVWQATDTQLDVES